MTNNNLPLSITLINTDSGVIAHKTGCRDIARDIKTHGLGPFPADHFVEDSTSKRQTFLDYNSDFIAEGGEENAWPIDWKPCCNSLPD